MVGVKFSPPDVEVRYDPAKQETVGIAHTVELLAKNLRTGETKLVPVGSTVIITAAALTIITGTTAAAIAAGTGTTAAATTGIGTGTMIAIGAGALAVAGGVAAMTASSGGGGERETAESTGDLSGIWTLGAQGVSQGCTTYTPCMSDPPYLCGISICGSFQMGDSDIQVRQAGNALSASEVDGNGHPFTLNGAVNGNSVSFTIQGIGITPGIGPANTTYTGVLAGNTISGNFSGSASWNTSDGRTETATWTGTFTVTIRKESTR